MGSEQKESLLPQALYFDTNALKQLLGGNSSVVFVNLRGIANTIKVSFFAPEVVIMELIHQREKEALGLTTELKSITRRLGDLLGRDSLKHEEPRETEATIKKTTMGHLDSAQIKLIPTPNIPLKTLIEMAVRKKAPFEEKGEKGFRDTVILFSIIEHMQKNRFTKAILVSGDGIFEHDDVTNWVNQKGLNISVGKSLHDARQLIEKHIDTAIKHLRDKKNQMIRSFLNTKRNEIFRYIRENAEVSKPFLEGWGKDRIIGGTIEKVLRVRPKEISDVSQGSLRASADTSLPEGTEYITFSVSTDFDVILSQYNPFSLLSGPKFALSKPEDFDKIKHKLAEPVQVETTVTRDITVDATLSKSNDHFFDLKLIRIRTY